MDAVTIERARAQAEICSIFSNPRRVLILWALSEGELTVSDIAHAVGISIQNASHHLRLMRDRGVLDAKRQGQHILYRIRPTPRLQCLLSEVAYPEFDAEAPQFHPEET